MIMVDAQRIFLLTKDLIITANELVGIIMLLWTIFVPILSCAISYFAKRLLCSGNLSDKELK
jgi:hypothetical protein